MMYDVCVIGAGIAGSSLATVLGRSGFKVALIERDWGETEGIVGELLQPGGVEMLKALDLDEALEGIEAQHITGYAMYLNNEWLEMQYPTNEDRVPDGYGFRYHKLIHNLRKKCQAQENVHCFTGTVQKLLESNEGIYGVQWTDENSGKKELKSQLTVISQGMLKSFGKSFQNSEVNVSGYMLGIILEDTKLPYDQHGHVVLSRPSPLLVYPVGKNQIRVLIDFNKDVPSLKGKELVSYLETNICPQLPPELQASFLESIRKQKFLTKAACNLKSRPVVKDGVVLIGDNLNMRHPITGGGMTVALTDVKLLSDFLIAESKPGALEYSAIRKFYKQRHQKDATINILADALYQVFRHEVLKVACFDYLSQGGKHSSEPMSILSGISRNRLTLIRHFFAVAFHAVKNYDRLGNGTPSWKVMRDAVRIIYPLLIAEFPKTYSKSRIVNKYDKHLIKTGTHGYEKNIKEPQRASA